MTTEAEARELVGRTMRLRINPEGGGGVVQGRVAGSLESPDGLVLFVEPSGQSGRRVTVHHQHLESFEEAPES